MSKLFTVLCANKRYSSWSMRGWLAVRYALGKSNFEEVVFNLAGPACSEPPMISKVDRLKYSPTGKAPIVIDHELNVTVYESIAVVMYMADRFPDAKLWPNNLSAKALCLSACAEMHTGFTAMRTHLTCHFVEKGIKHGREALKRADVLADIQRLGVLFTELRTRFGQHQNGPFLFGHFTCADCMYAPVAVRFMDYDPDFQSLAEYPVAQEYLKALYNMDLMKEWIEDAKREGPTTYLQYYEEITDNYDPSIFAEPTK